MKPNITRTFFLTIFDEFSTVPTAKVDAFIDLASMRVAPALWKGNTPYATALMTAHMLVVASRGATGGPTIHESVGELSKGYSAVGTQGSGDQELMTTRYGQEFVSLRRESICCAMVLGG